MHLFLFLCLILFVLAYSAYSYKLGFKRALATAALTTITFSPIITPIDFLGSTISSSVCRADSTGKFSTKLTARKRYLPRIITGVSEYKALLAAPTLTNTQSFVEDKLPGLQRAMNLYGASLRKGEVPDEISREATELTEAFVGTMSKLVDNKSNAISSEALQNSKKALDTYLKFASLSPVDSDDYKLQ